MCKALTRQVVRSTDTFQGFFFNCMISLPWNMEWKCQRAVRHARSRFDGCLVSMAQNHGYYIVCHDGIKATISEGLYDTGHPGDLSNVGLSMFLADIVLLIKKVCQPFQVAQEAKAVPFCMSHALQLKNMDAAI